MKKNLLRISLLIIAVLLLFCFAACDDNDDPATKEQVRIEFEIGRGAEFADEDFEGEIKIDKGTALEKFPEAIKEGYEIEGWYLDEDFEEKCTSDYKFNSKLTVLYAKWVEVIPPTTYTVKFDTSRAGNPIKLPNQVIIEGGKVVAPDYTPTKKGMTFFGWCVGGDKSKVWDFETSTVTSNITLTAVFELDGSSSGNTCEHNFEVVERSEPTCESEGRIVQRCTICRIQQRLGAKDDPALAKKEHLTLEEHVEPTCALDGYTRIYCPNGCGMESTFIHKATGDHEYDDMNWYTSVQPTKYVTGIYENLCIKCDGAPIRQNAYYTATEDDLKKADVSYLYTGGNYVNEKFVNIATLGSVKVSSFYTVAKGGYINDGDAVTAWNADTYVESANYTADWFTIEFMESYEIGAVRFVLPNYAAWNLGEGCYVSYDLEYWDETKEEWVYIGEISDKNAKSIGINCELMLELDSPIKASKLRGKVTHAGRYTPAAIYELEVFAKTKGTQRVPVAVNTEATYSVSGKYNDWVLGAGALGDNSQGTFWTTDARYNPTPVATLEFAVEKYIAGLQISTKAIPGRTFKLEIYENDNWVTISDKLVVPVEGTGGYVIQNSKGVCTFNIDIERNATKIKVTIVKEPQYWESVVYDITPYSIIEKSYGELETMECKHSNPLKGEVIAPTCDTAGYTVMTCACGFQTRSFATDALGHDFGKYTIGTPATATTIGTKVSTCRNGDCGAISTINYEEKYDLPVATPYLHNAPAAWVQSLDDGNYLEAYTWGNEFFPKYGAKATVMMSITYSDSLVSIWQEHFEKGVFDLGSHSYNHTSIYSAAASEGTLYDEVVKAQYWFRYNFRNQPLITFAAPLGATSASVANFLMGPLAANRNGGDTGVFYNTIDQLKSREVWGDLNSYISKADQTEGDYVFVKNGDTTGAFVKGPAPSTDEEGTGALVGYLGTESFVYNAAYENMNINFVFDENEKTFVDKGYSAGSYEFIPSEYKYVFRESGSYNLVDGKFEFVSDNSGEYKLYKATISRYEKAIEQLVELGGFTVECLHTIAQSSGVIYTKYEPTVSKLEHLARLGVWAASYNDLIQYLKESLDAKIQVTERTDSVIRLSVTDNLDDFMFNQEITVKVDIPDNWTNVTVTQNGKEIPLVDIDFYQKTINMYTVGCAIDDGYLYVDVVPDAGEVVITVNDKNDSADYEEKATVTFEPGEGKLNSMEYETRVVIGEAIGKLPTPVRTNFTFTGWYTSEDAEISTRVNRLTKIDADTTLYAGWEEIPTCRDGSYDHKWGSWLEDSEKVFRTCNNCPATQYDYDKMYGDTTGDAGGEGEGEGGGEVNPPAPEACAHTGKLTCELCGESFVKIIADLIKEKGEFAEASNSYAFIDELEYEGVIQYIELRYDEENDKLVITYKPSSDKDVVIDLASVASDSYTWSYTSQGITISGTGVVSALTNETTELEYVDGDTLPPAPSQDAAKYVKSAIYLADTMLKENNASAYGMDVLGFNPLS